MISGDRSSLVRWATMGREGRRHAIAYVRPEPLTDRPMEVGGQALPELSMRTVMQEDPKASPIEVFVGLDSAPTPAERVDFALAEMDRTDAWSRSLLMLISPTGTGYVNYVATACVQYLTRGDVASVTLQYSKRPSPLSLGKVKDAREQNRLLWLRIFKRVRAMPPERGPRSCLRGVPGALTSQDVLTRVGHPWAAGARDRPRIVDRDAGGQSVDARGDRSAAVRCGQEFGRDGQRLRAVLRLGEELKEHVRYVLLSHDNDGVTKFGPSLINRRPAWLGPQRPMKLETPGTFAAVAFRRRCGGAWSPPSTRASSI